MKKFTYRLLILPLLLLVLVAPVVAAEISSGYSVNQPLATGTVVSVDPDTDRRIEPTTTANAEDMLGVINAKNESLAEISEEDDNAQVVTNGLARILATAVDGTIEAGDPLTPVSIAGVASKASNQKVVVGVAQEGFDGTGDNVIGTLQELTGFSSEDVPGNTPIGLIEAEVNVVTNPNLEAGLFQSIGNYFTGRGTGPLQFVLAFLIFVTTLDIVGTVLYGSAKGSLISLGRNPRAKREIAIGLAEVSLISVTVLVIALVSMSFLLG